MKPIHYYIKLEPDLKKFITQGETRIEVELNEPVEEITLNAKELAIWECTVEQHEEVMKCAYKIDPEAEELTIYMPKKLSGTIVIQILFSGQINESLLGLYRTRYVVDGETKYAAVTQFEERHARKAFPCFDHPALKATFDIEFVIDKDLQGVSNMPILKEEIREDGKKLVRFERTPKMSTYLLFFGIGEFEFLIDENKTPVIRIVTAPGKVQYGKFALDVARKIIDWGEKFTGVKYPLPKLDHIAVTDFAFGAMENFGAILYRENLLLVYPGITSKAGKERIATIVAHESAHMWFGDLVSPKDWKYIWLNESFASYFTYAMTADLFPEWELWNTFIAYIHGGIERDSLRNTIPIELPGEDAQVNIDTSTAPIIYNKGAAIISVLEDFLGTEKFQKGIGYFLEKHKFDAATTIDYWQAFEEATGENVTKFADSWVHQKGYPLIICKREGNKLHLSQHRFTFLPLEDQSIWFIPITYAIYKEDGSIEVLKNVMDNKELEIELPADAVAVKLNYGQKGYYRVKYDEEMLNQLAELIRNKKMPETDVYGIENDLFALLRQGTYDLDFFLEFVKKNFAEEDRYLPISDLSSNLYAIYLMVPDKRDKIAEVAKLIFENVLSKIGYEPKEEDNVRIARLRDTLIWRGFQFGSEQAKEYADKLFLEWREGKQIPADILSSVVKVGAAIHPEHGEYILKRLESHEATETEKVHLLGAIASFRDEKLIEIVTNVVFDKVPLRNRGIVLQTLSTNPIFMPKAWQWFKDNIEQISKIPPSHIGSVIIAYAIYGGLDKKEEVTQFLNEFAEKNPRHKPSVEMALELVEVFSKLRN
ncbi:MAG: M1 family metallopeptidase [Candidatus Heimdallarchaeaceae archaeon]